MKLIALAVALVVVGGGTLAWYLYSTSISQQPIEPVDTATTMETIEPEPEEYVAPEPEITYADKAEIIAFLTMELDVSSSADIRRIRAHDAARTYLSEEERNQLAAMSDAELLQEARINARFLQEELQLLATNPPNWELLDDGRIQLETVYASGAQSVTVFKRYENGMWAYDMPIPQSEIPQTN